MIRPYQQGDYDQLIHLMRLNTPSFFGVEEEEHLVRFLTSDPANFFVLEQGSIVVGCAGYGFLEGGLTGQVSWFIFHPDYQGQGLGRKALDYCLVRLQEDKNLKKIIVRTSQLVEGFFARAGFRTTKIEKDYWAPGFDLYFMELIPA